MELKRVAIAKLKLDEKNPRVHGDRNQKLIAKSLDEFGQVEPLVVQRKTNRVIAGHGRIVALKERGDKEVDVVYVDVDDKQARKLGLLLNRTAETAEWDAVNLKALIDQAAEDDPDFNLEEDFGFSDDELAALIDLGEAPDDDDDGKPAGDQSGEVTPRYQIVVTCPSETAQVKLLQKLSKEGFECRALVS